VSTLTCAAVRELAAELALDVLDGDERAAALAHLQTCAECRDEVASLTRAGDELFLLVPEATPAPGFEQRVLDRLAEPGGPSRARGPVLPRRAQRRRRLLAAAAALAAVVLGTNFAR
jgi:anti-sigma-K factor RskA